MYSVIILLYIADVIGQIKNAASFFLNLCIFATFLLGFLIALKKAVKCLNGECDVAEPLIGIGTFAEGIIKSKLFISGFIVCLLLVIFSPSSRLLYIVAGLHVGNDLIKSQAVNSFLDKSYKIIDYKLDEILDEIEDTKKFVDHK